MMASGPRYVFLDVLRGIAVLWMIQVHITNVLLDPALRSTSFFNVLNLSNGFVAPTFIFAAGSGLWIALSRKGASYLQLDRSLLDYLFRLSYILFWAYMLHVPTFSLVGLLSMPTSEVLPWLQLDVLHTIVYTSVVALGVFLLVKNLRTATMIYGVLSLCIMFVTAFLTNVPVLGVLTVTPFHPFPILPWATYLFAGAFVTGLFMQTENKRSFALRLMLIGASLPVLIFMFKEQPFTSPWTDVWWKTSPGMHLFRISGILLTFGALYLLEERLRLSKSGVFLQTVGTESLFLYISHLLVVYGAGGVLMKSMFGVEYTGYGGVAIAWVLITVPLIIVMYQWKRIKKHHPVLARRMLAIQIAWMIATLILLPDSYAFLDAGGQ